jgi:hypothetical protein
MLKERRKTPELASVAILKCYAAFYDSAFGLILSLFQSYALFAPGTQGSAKPPPWAIILPALRASIVAHPKSDTLG